MAQVFHMPKKNKTVFDMRQLYTWLLIHLDQVLSFGLFSDFYEN